MTKEFIRATCPICQSPIDVNQDNGHWVAECSCSCVKNKKLAGITCRLKIKAMKNQRKAKDNDETNSNTQL